VQDAFVRLYKSWGRLRDPESAPAYLRSTVVNLARGRARKQAVFTRIKERLVAPDDAMSAEDRAVGLAIQDLVNDALARLSSRQREVLVLRHYAGMTESEIADAVGCSVGTVRTHTKRGMAALEVLLEGVHGDAVLEGVR
jgi:RNA polymerase sigma factor (sigma-70 family)